MSLYDRVLAETTDKRPKKLNADQLEVLLALAGSIDAGHRDYTTRVDTQARTGSKINQATLKAIVNAGYVDGDPNLTLRLTSAGRSAVATARRAANAAARTSFSAALKAAAVTHGVNQENLDDLSDAFWSALMDMTRKFIAKLDSTGELDKRWRKTSTDTVHSDYQPREYGTSYTTVVTYPDKFTAVYLIPVRSPSVTDAARVAAAEADVPVSVATAILTDPAVMQRMPHALADHTLDLSEPFGVAVDPVRKSAEEFVYRSLDDEVDSDDPNEVEIGQSPRYKVQDIRTKRTATMDADRLKLVTMATAAVRVLWPEDHEYDEYM